jgi:predicted enzyme related to lactoylglutathione lyase
MPGSVTHFEIYGEDPAKLAHFYRELFGWVFEKAAGIDYWRIQTGPTTGNALNAGLTYRHLPRIRSWLNYISVNSVDDSLDQAQRLGGEVLTPKTAVPRAGWYAVIADPAGNIFAIWQNDFKAFPPPQPEA